MKDNFQEQLEEFRQDDSYFQEYPETITKPEHCLLRFFQFNPNDGKELTKEQKEFRKSLIVPGQKAGQSESTAAESIGVKVTNIAKVIKGSSSSKFTSGDIVILGYEKVRGDHENGELSVYLKSVGAKGVGTAGDISIIPPEDMRKRIPNIERHLARFMYKNSNNDEVTSADRLTYLIPDIEILSKE